jgi:fumarate reductase flavoprotein subunit
MAIEKGGEDKKNYTRRSFVKIAAGGVGATTLLAAFHPQEVLAKVPKKWDVEADIVVVGAGGAGLAAATEAGTRGAKVVVLEKLPVMGGSSAICGGALAFAGTDMQAEKGIQDSNELLYKDLMTVGENVNVPALVQAYVDNQLETYKWLKQLGVNFINITILSGMSVPRSHNVKPSEVIKILIDAAKEKGVRIFPGTAGQRLVIDDKTGQIRGVIAERKGKSISYGARKGVILTSGGFARNKNLIAKFVPPMANAKVIAGLGSTGDGLKMAWACGADLQDMPYIKATFGFDLEAKTITEDIAAVFYHGAIIVNKEGKRFINESKSYKLIGDAALAQKDGVGFQVFDAAIRDKRIKADPGGSLNSLEKRDRIFSAPSLIELAQKMGIPPAALEETVRDYNTNIEKGVDPLFGRTALVASFGKPVKIDTPPFYAFPSAAAILGTYGGILINDKTQVVDVFGNVVAGLYAAGEITGGVHGAAYMTGTSFGKSLIFGRFAVKNMLAGK